MAFLAMLFLTVAFPVFNPVAIALGPIVIRWYALAYIGGIVLGWIYARALIKNQKLWNGSSPITLAQMDDFVLWVTIGIIVGGRTGYVLFYNPFFFLQHPAEIFELWKGGMSFHGGFLGCVAAVMLFALKNNISILSLGDITTAVGPIGLFLGRIANFINSELWGKVTNVPWGFKVNGEVRHASQLYEAGLEGLLLFSVLWWYTSKPRPRLAPSGVFMLGYGLSRTLVEFVRVPDEHIGYLAGGWVTEGQLLSLPMIILGLAFLAWAYRARVPSGNYITRQ